MSFQVIQFQYRSEFVRLSYSQFVQSFQDVIMLVFYHRQQNIVIPMSNSEHVGVVFDRIVGSSDPEVLVDQVSNLSSSKETVLFLGLLFLQTDFPLKWELWMILFRAEAILATST